MAIKLECIKTRHPQLHIESKFYKMMQGGGKLQFFIYSVFTNLSYLGYIFVHLLKYVGYVFQS